MFESRCRQKGVDWRVEGFGGSPIPVRGDEGKLRQVFINLLGNAVKFTERGSVTLSVERRSGDIFSFRVVDTGPGIPLETQQTLFEPFTQGAEGKHKGGTGLGLAISRRQIELMGGELRLESAPGQGARFSFSLHLPPALGEIAAKVTRTGQRALRLQEGFSATALVVDDVSDNRDVLAHLLKDLGVTVAVERHLFNSDPLTVHEPNGRADLQVRPTVRFMESGKSRLRVVATVLSGDNGEYRFINLRPGSYQVRCQIQDAYANFRGTATPGPSAAGALKVELGTAHRAINFQLAEIKKGFGKSFTPDDGLPHHQRGAVGTIERGGQQLLALINEILDLSKIESGRMELAETDFDLHELVSGLSVMFELRCRQKELRFQVEWNLNSEAQGPKSKAQNQCLKMH